MTTSLSRKEGSIHSSSSATTQGVLVTASTSTQANPPTVSGFQVFATSAAIILGNNFNPIGTAIAVSTGTDFNFGAAISSQGRVAGADTTLYLTGLTPNTTYSFQAGAWDSTVGK
jgi:hypothetical protein